MTLIVEDGTGKIDADSYTDLDYYRKYCTLRGYDLSQYTDPQLETQCIRATLGTDVDYDTRYIGRRYTPAQALGWPRLGAVGTVTGRDYDAPAMPQPLIDAVCERAWRIATGEIGHVHTDHSSDRVVLSESKTVEGVGSKSYTYADTKTVWTPSTSDQVVAHLRKMLRDVLDGSAGLTGIHQAPIKRCL